ncbi:MAG: class I SAM-dependent methyltransferase [Bacteroidetes bacterium]|nr:class I SAM-dependent methyltransferase [Bacteroidota bacterium]MBS1944371.1 class I SAM-dependent methyltransferase [Bacteroidota bacterium]
MSGPTLVEQAYWDASYANMRPCIAPVGDVVRQWLEREVPHATGGQHALEIGCYPGRYLAVLGTLGYVVHGIDLTPGVVQMKPALGAMGLHTGDFIHADFLHYVPQRKYDLVSSFGFIEHFHDWKGMVERHADLVAPGGLLVLETPNFRGWVQQLFHRALDATNLRRHHLGAMRPTEWARMLHLAGFQVISHGYLGSFSFWSDSPAPNLMQRALRRVLCALVPWLERKGTGREALAPYCILIARKPLD